jgi:hypothetical protein
MDEGKTMINESDLSQEKRWFYELRAKTIVNSFQSKNINAQYVFSRDEAVAAVLKMIPAAAIVARGDSVTLEQTGIMTELKKRRQNEIIDPFERDTSDSSTQTEEDAEQKRQQVMKACLSADIFLTGTNAVTLDGKLVNIDGGGNRVGAMIFGPRKVIVVAGVNKIVNDVDEALKRIHNIAAPMNAMRHYLKHQGTQFGDLPCVKVGRCVNCNHEWKICRFTVIIDGATPWQRGRINVVLVGEELGI